MATSHNLSRLGDDDVVLERLWPEGGFELYRYKNVDKMRTKNWHGYYWPSVLSAVTMIYVAYPPPWGSTRCLGVSSPRRVSSSITKRWTRRPPQPTP